MRMKNLTITKKRSVAILTCVKGPAALLTVVFVPSLPKKKVNRERKGNEHLYTVMKIVLTSWHP